MRRRSPFGWTPPQATEPHYQPTHHLHQMPIFDSCSNFELPTDTNDLTANELATLENNNIMSSVDLSFNPIPSEICNNYPYINQLLKLESYTDSKLSLLPLPALTIVTPLVHEEWLIALASHPDKAFTEYLLTGIKNGFHIGFDRHHTCRQSTSNMRSALLHS